MDDYEKVAEAASAIRTRTRQLPTVAVVLGSGLGDFADSLGNPVAASYTDLPHWPVPTTAGHAGRLVIGTSRGRLVAALAGRCHAYEGHDLRAVTFGVRVLGVLGIRTLILTNAAGGINAGLTQGALMVIDDHINLMGDNPLVGPNDERFGPRFPDMTAVYSSRLRAVAEEAGHEAGLSLSHGIYAGMLGPSYETPAEIRYLRTIGADAVGMSTVPEAIAARHMGIDVLGISCITNAAAAGVPARRLDHADVVETARHLRGPFMALLEAIIGRLS
jgi:purine-nucleoside phosphorylase